MRADLYLKNLTLKLSSSSCCRPESLQRKPCDASSSLHDSLVLPKLARELFY